MILQFFSTFWQIFFVVNDQKVNKYLAIWSHWLVNFFKWNKCLQLKPSPFIRYLTLLFALQKAISIIPWFPDTKDIGHFYYYVHIGNKQIDIGFDSKLFIWLHLQA